MSDISLVAAGDAQSFDIEELMNQPTLLKVCAYRPDTSPLILARLACHEDKDVRLAVARNPHTPPEILAVLSEDKDRGSEHTACIQAVADNPSTPPNVLAHLVSKKGCGLENALRNSSTPLVSIVHFFMGYVNDRYKDAINFNRRFSEFIDVAAKMDAEYLETLGRDSSQFASGCDSGFPGDFDRDVDEPSDKRRAERWG